MQYQWKFYYIRSWLPFSEYECFPASMSTTHDALIRGWLKVEPAHYVNSIFWVRNLISKSEQKCTFYDFNVSYTYGGALHHWWLVEFPCWFKTEFCLKFWEYLTTRDTKDNFKQIRLNAQFRKLGRAQRVVAGGDKFWVWGSKKIGGNTFFYMRDDESPKWNSSLLDVFFILFQTMKLGHL